MDLLDRLLGHDAWTTQQLLEKSASLTDAQLDQEFDIAHRTVRTTFLHIIWNMEAWSDAISGKPLRPNPNRELEARTIAGMLARLDGAAADLAAVARPVDARKGWDERWPVLDSPPRDHSYGGAIAHVITHSMHHRAQLLHMLKKLGLEGLPEGDVLSWEEQHGG